MIEGNFGRNNAWEMLNDYTVTCKTDAQVFSEGKLYVPDQLIDFFGIEYAEKRVECLFEGREFPCYLEKQSAEGNVTFSWSKALTGKFFSLFPDYENFFATVNEYNEDETPVIYMEKMEEDTFLIKLILPTDEALTLKQTLFDFLGPGKSIANFNDSYEMVFFKTYMELVDNRWRSDVFMVAAQVQKFYIARVNAGKEQDKNAAYIIENVAAAALDDILSFLMEHPYMTFADKGIMAMETVDEHFYFTIENALIDELSTDERRLLIEMMNEKIEYYFARFDGPGLQENLQQFMDQYQSYFTRDFRYSFKEVVTNDIPASVSGLKCVSASRYKVTGFAGIEDWAIVPYISIMDKNVTRFPNTGVSVQYLLNKDTRTLYLALAYGFKEADAQARKNGLENEKTIAVAVEGAIEGFVKEIREGLQLRDFSTIRDDIELPLASHAASMICYRQYANAVPDNDKLEADMAEMIAIYDEYYKKFILKQDPYQSEEEENEEDTVADETAEVVASIEFDENAEKDVENAEKEDSVEENLIEAESVDEVQEESDAAEAFPEMKDETAASDEDQPEISGIDVLVPAAERETALADALNIAQEIVNTDIADDQPPVPVKKETHTISEAEISDAVMPVVREAPIVVNVPPAEPFINEETLSMIRQLLAENKKPGLIKRDRGIKREETAQSAGEQISAVLKQMREYICAYGFDCDDQLVQNMYLSIKAGPLLLISGGAGAGKSQFVRLFAEAMGASTENGRFKRISVSSNWHSSNALIGYLENSDTFIPGMIADLVADAVDNPELPYFLCLDEMGLVEIEGYFSEILSLLETRRLVNGTVITDPLIDDALFGRDEAARQYYGNLYLPDNLTIIGTICPEDARKYAGRNILDRAQIIEISPSGLQLGELPTSVPQTVTYDAAFTERDALILSHLAHHREMVQDVITLLEAINGILKTANVHFGYRVRDKICFYLLCNASYGLMTKENALDYAIEQNVLPCIMGNTPAVETVMKDLFKICAGTVADSAIRKYPGGGLFPHTAEKLSQMILRYDAGETALYWR